MVKIDVGKLRSDVSEWDLKKDSPFKKLLRFNNRILDDPRLIINPWETVVD